MKLGMPILYEYNTLKENISLAKKLNLDFIELNLNFGYLRDELENNKDLFKELQANNLEVTCHFYDEADFGSYQEITDGYIKLLKKYLKYLRKLKVKVINFHLNVGPVVTISGVKNYLYEKEYDEYLKRLKKNLLIIKKILDKDNIIMVLENVKTPEFLIKTYLDLKDEFVFNYDIGHDNNDGDKLLTISDKLTFKEFHIHDGNYKTCHLAIGEGLIDIKKYKEMAKDAYVVLEVKSSKDLLASVDIFRSL